MKEIHFMLKFLDDFTPFGEEPSKSMDYQRFIDSWRLAEDEGEEWEECIEDLTYDNCASNSRKNIAARDCRKPFQSDAFKTAIIAGVLYFCINKAYTINRMNEPLSNNHSLSIVVSILYHRTDCLT